MPDLLVLDVVITEKDQQAIAKITDKLGEAGKAAKETGKNIKEAAEAVGGFNAAAVVAAVGAAGALAAVTMASRKLVEGMISLVETSATEARAVENMAVALGTSSEKMEVWRLTAKEAGIGIDRITMAASMMERKVVEGSKGFEKLGLSAKQLGMMEAGDALDLVMEKLAGIPNSFDRAAAAGEIFGGRSARALLPFIEQMAQAKVHAEELGITLGEDEHAALVKMNTAVVDLAAAWKAVGEHMAAVIVHGGDMEVVVRDLAQSVGSLAKTIKEHQAELSFLFKIMFPEVAGTEVGTSLRHKAEDVTAAILSTINDYQTRGTGDAMTGGSVSSSLLGTNAAKRNPYDSKIFQPPGLDSASIDEQLKLSKDLTAQIAAAKRQATNEEIADRKKWEREEMDLLGHARTEEERLIAADWDQEYKDERDGMIKRGHDQARRELADSEEYKHIKDEESKRSHDLAQAQITFDKEREDDLKIQAAGYHRLGSELRAAGGAVGGPIGTVISAVGTSFNMAGDAARQAAENLKNFGKEAETAAQAQARIIQLAATMLSAGVAGYQAGNSKSGVMAGAQAGAGMGIAGMFLGAVIGGMAGGYAAQGWEQRNIEAGNILGRRVTHDYVKGLQQAADDAGVSFTEYVKALHAKEQLAIEQQKDQNVKQGLATAQAGLDAIYKALPDLADTPELHAAIAIISQKVADAMAKAGLGYMITGSPLAKDKAYLAAQGAGAGAGQILAGMRQAGTVDTGLSSAMGPLADELRRQAYDAARAAGLSPEEATKAGFGAITPILTQQLNNSLATGNKLDAKTQELIDEAKRNGINIVADPLLVANSIAADQLTQLQTIAGNTMKIGDPHGNPTIPKTPPGTPVPGAPKGDPDFPTVGAASGYLSSRQLERDTMFLAHAGEHIFIAPARMDFIKAATGFYARRGDGEGGGRGGGGGGGGAGAGGGTGIPGGSGTGSGVNASTVAAIADAVARAKPSITISAPLTVIPQIDPTLSAATAQDAVDRMAEGLDKILRTERGPGGRLATTIRRITGTN